MIYKYFFFLSKTFPNIEGVKDIYDSIFIIHVVSDLVTICTCGCGAIVPSLCSLHHKGNITLVISNISTRCWRLWTCYGSHSLSLCIIQICFRHWQFEMWPAQPAACRFLSILQWGKTLSIYQQNDEKVSKTPDRFLIDSFNLEI